MSLFKAYLNSVKLTVGYMSDKAKLIKWGIVILGISIIFVCLIQSLSSSNLEVQYEQSDIEERRFKNQTFRMQMYKRPDFFQGKLYVTKEPLLQQPILLVFQIKPMRTILKTTIIFSLPSGIQKVSGTLEKVVPKIDKNQSYHLGVLLKVVKTGDWRIRAYVEGESPKGHKEYRSYYIFLCTTPAGGFVRWLPRAVNTDTSRNLKEVESIEQKSRQEDIPGRKLEEE